MFSGAMLHIRRTYVLTKLKEFFLSADSIGLVLVYLLSFMTAMTVIEMPGTALALLSNVWLSLFLIWVTATTLSTSVISFVGLSVRTRWRGFLTYHGVSLVLSFAVLVLMYPYLNWFALMLISVIVITHGYSLLLYIITKVKK